MIVSLAAARGAETVGGKSASLGRMLRAGVRVPAGMVIQTAAFESFLGRTGRRDEITALLNQVDPECPTSLERISSTIVAWLKETPLPSGLEAELAEFFEQRAQQSLVVRSSAVGEDSQRASFAGQLDSFLNIRDKGALIEAVKDCWCSFYSARGLAYQRATKVALKGMAVVVQEQIHGVVSGVAFTQAPQDSRCILIEWCEGTCEALVSGAVVPQSLCVQREEQVSLPELPMLTANQLRELQGAALRLEELFGSPQDIEWTFDAAGSLYILQSRPITTAAAVPEHAVYSNANINENYPGPVTPFLQSIAKTSYAHYFRNLAVAYGFASYRIEAMEDALLNIVGVHGQRLYYDVSNIHAVLRMAPWGPLFAEWFNKFVGVEETTQARARDLTWSRGTVGRGAEVVELLSMAVKIVRQYRRMVPQVEDFESAVARYADRCHPEHLRALSKDDLVGLLNAFVEIRCHRWLGATLADSACMVCCGALDRFLARFFSEPSDVVMHGLLRGLPGIVSSEPPKHLWRISRKIRANAAWTSLFEETTVDILDTLGWDGEALRATHPVAAVLQGFLDDWGFRCTGELMMTTSSFQEEPHAVVDMLRSYAAMDEEGPEDVIQRQAAKRLEQTQELKRQLNPVARGAFERLLKATADSLALRERARLKQAQLYRCCRRVVLALGARLVDSGLLSAKDDVLFMSWQELRDVPAKGVVSKKQLAGRRERFERESQWPQPPARIVLPRGRSWQPLGANTGRAEDRSEDERLKGIAAAGGCVTARAAVARGQQDFHRVQSGDILVAPQTDPGWATVLFMVKGLVMERGGMLSHGAIIAREFGIPSVVGVPRVTERVPNGSTICVDGDEGYVHIQ